MMVFVLRKSLLAAALVILALPQQSPAQDNLTLSERVERLERQVGSGGGSTADLVVRLRRIEEEVRELRGQVEQQQHQLESLQARQRDQYLDLDRRLQALANGQGGQASDTNGRNADGKTAEESSPRRASGAGEPPVSADATPEQDAAEAGRPVADAKERQKAYDRAFSKLRGGEYAAAAEAFRAFLEEFPEGPLADNAQYWLGESYYVTGNYDIAVNAFQDVLDDFPESAKAPDSLLKLGFCYFELEQWDQARETLERVRERYPDSSVARLAQNRLRMMRIDGR
jgi:tol-pal system protein YbgF